MVRKGEASLRRLERASENPYEDNVRLLKKIIKDNKDTFFGKEHDFGTVKSVSDFQKQVPISVYDDFKPLIERTKDGETGLLTSSEILGYSRTSGSSGVPKFIPATKPSLQAYVNYTWTRALALGARRLRSEGKRYRPGRGVFLSPATNETLPNGLPCSNIAEIGAREYGRFYPFILSVPTRNLFAVEDGDYVYCVYRFALADPRITFIFSVFFSINVSQTEYLRKNWQRLVDDIETGTVSPEVEIRPETRAMIEKKVRPMPERAAYLRKQFEQGFDKTLFKRIWPDLTVISGIGNASFRADADYLRTLCDGVYFDFSIYGASEGLIAACRELENDEMQLLTDSCFYEFIPIEGDCETPLTLDKVKAGEKYEILITTQAGLYRYKLKDVIEVRGFHNKVPLISFVRRKGQLFNLAGEKFSLEDAEKTIEALEKDTGERINDWLFYQDNSVIPGRYVLAVENAEAIGLTDMVDTIEEHIGMLNKRYASQREKGFIGRLCVREQQPGSHAEWAALLVSRGASAAQVKPVRVLDTDEKKEFFISRLK